MTLCKLFIEELTFEVPKMTRVQTVPIQPIFFIRFACHEIGLAFQAPSLWYPAERAVSSSENTVWPLPWLLSSLVQLWRRRRGAGSWRCAGCSWSRAPPWHSPTAAASSRSSALSDRATGRSVGSSHPGVARHGGSGHPFHLTGIGVEKTSTSSFGEWSEWKEVFVMFLSLPALAGYRQLCLSPVLS